MQMVAFIFNQLVSLYILVIFVSVILSWLISFHVVNRGNQFVDAVWRAGTALTGPLLAPIRSMMPSMGGLDLSPIILLIGLQAVQVGLNAYVFGPMIRAGL